MTKPSSDTIFETIEKERGGVAEIHKAFFDFPEGVRAHYQFYKEIMLSDNLPLKRAEREFLAVKTSEANACPYCISHHEATLQNFSTDGFVGKRKDALESLAAKLTKEPWKAQPLLSMFAEAGFSPAEWQHAVMIVSYFNFANRCAHAMSLEIENDFEKTCR